MHVLKNVKNMVLKKQDVLHNSQNVNKKIISDKTNYGKLPFYGGFFILEVMDFCAFLSQDSNKIAIRVSVK